MVSLDYSNQRSYKQFSGVRSHQIFPKNLKVPLNIILNMWLLRNPFSEYHAPLWYLLYSLLEFPFLALLQRIYLFLEWAGLKNPPSKNRQEISITNKVVVITGANSGLGKHAALEMAKRGAIVILACRDLKKGEPAKQEIMKDTGNNKVVSKLKYNCLKNLSKLTELIFFFRNSTN